MQSKMTSRDPNVAKVVQFPDLKRSARSTLLGQEIGTQFDYGMRLFAYFGEGDVFLP
jgi:hypothetical protein